MAGTDAQVWCREESQTLGGRWNRFTGRFFSYNHILPSPLHDNPLTYHVYIYTVFGGVGSPGGHLSDKTPPLSATCRHMLGSDEGGWAMVLGDRGCYVPLMLYYNASTDNQEEGKRLGDGTGVDREASRCG